MTPNGTSPEQELASAYLDGEVTAIERARVEATPELQALVASMREAKSLVAAVPKVSDAVRNAAIASALGEFNVVSLDSHRRWPNRVLAAAAAAVLIGVVGISVLQNTSNDSKTASRDAEPKFDTNAAEDAVGAAVPETAGGQVLESMVAPIVIDDPQQLLALTIPLPPTADTPTADTAGTPSTGSATTMAAADTQRIESFNVEALACMHDDQVFLADVYYKGTLAIAVRDTVTGVTEAIDNNCTVLASVSP